MIPHDIDHAALIGAYPFRRLPDPTPRGLLAQMDRHGVARAWVGHVPSVWYRDVAAGNDELLEALERHGERLAPVPAVNPVWPGWELELDRARDAHAPAVRTYPAHMGYASTGPAMAELAAACAERRLALVLTVRFEDARQRSRLDVAPDLIGADIRAAVRSHEAVRVLVVGADRAIVEEVHWGSTPQESSRIAWDISGIWGAPEDHLTHLVRTVGADRFVFGTHFPFRLYESAVAKLALSR